MVANTSICSCPGIANRKKEFEASELMLVALEMAKHFLPKRKNEFTFSLTYPF
jgi:hypothetical protein